MYDRGESEIVISVTGAQGPPTVPVHRYGLLHLPRRRAASLHTLPRPSRCRAPHAAPLTRQVRIFVSHAAEDTRHEADLLRTRVWPKLAARCEVRRCCRYGIADRCVAKRVIAMIAMMAMMSVLRSTVMRTLYAMSAHPHAHVHSHDHSHRRGGCS